jgi:hypothetical protein
MKNIFSHNTSNKRRAKWDDHLKCEFQTHDVETTMKTMVIKTIYSTSSKATTNTTIITITITIIINTSDRRTAKDDHSGFG